MDEGAPTRRDDSETALSGAADPEASALPTMGTTVGRFELRGVLGEGGMGRVYRAHDPTLDREVALKVLRARTRRGADALWGEAQAMARLSHPNVLPVFDVGRHEGSLFIAMELVEGDTLRGWLRGRSRSVPEIVEVFLAAGRGLVAAHEAGLVHRDFKPSNVMIGDDGHVRVMDFGLARVGDEGSGSGGPATVGHDGGPLSQTQSGSIEGTPPYMAPEQHLGPVVGEAGDQYAFCVSLWEALHGVRPFAAETFDELLEAKHRGPPASPRPLPHPLHALMVRGLSVRPQDRFDSMTSLLADLGRVVRRRNPRWIIGLSLASVVGVVALGSSLGRTPLCEGGEERIAAVWDETRRTQVHEAMTGSGLAYAPETWDRVGPALDGYAQQWVDGYAEACRDTHVRQRQTEEELDARVRCLEDRRRDFDAFVQMLVEADAAVVRRATQSAGSLPRIERCADPSYFFDQSVPPPDPALADEVAALREAQARANALSNAGKYDQAFEKAQEVHARALNLDYRPLVVESGILRGVVLDYLVRHDEAATAMREAYFEAEQLGLDALQARAAIFLVWIVGYKQAEYEEGLRWGKHADALVDRLGDPVLRARLLNNRSAVHTAMGEGEMALAELREAIELREQLLGPDHPRLAFSLNNLGATLLSQGHFDRAFEPLMRGLAIQRAALGPGHPQVGQSMANLAGLMAQRQHHGLALRIIEDAIRIIEQALGPDHPSLADLLNVDGFVLGALGRDEDALAIELRVYELYRKALGDRHERVSTARFNLGNSHRRLELWAESVEHYRGALDIQLELLPGDHDDIRRTRGQLAQTLIGWGHRDEAALALRDAVLVLGEDQRKGATDLGGRHLRLAQACLEAGEFPEALAAAEKAHALYEDAGLDAAAIAQWQLPTHTRGEADFVLAQSLRAAGRQPSRARTLAQQARRHYVEVGVDPAPIDAWLAESSTP